MSAKQCFDHLAYILHCRDAQSSLCAAPLSLDRMEVHYVNDEIYDSTSHVFDSSMVDCRAPFKYKDPVSSIQLKDLFLPRVNSWEYLKKCFANL